MAIGTSDTVSAHGNHRVSIAIAAPPELAYALWTQFEDFPRYFRHVLEVTPNPNNRLLQHWRGKAMGIEQEWDAEITTLTPNRVIAWRSINGFENSGSITFERNLASDLDGAGTTEMTVQIGYDPPMGALGDLAEAVWVKQRFDEGLEEDMTRFKELAEGLYRKAAERIAAGEPMETAVRGILTTEGGITEQTLSTRIETGSYDMSHAPMPNIITTTELKNRLDWGETAITIIDVRPIEFFKEAHIQGANAAPIEVLEERVKEITAVMGAQAGDRQLIIYSDRDGLSAEAAARLYAAGYQRVFDYTDGFSSWRSAGLSVETQSVGQIQAKGLPERSDYVERVTAAPSVNDNEPTDFTGAAQETISPKAFGIPGARTAEAPSLSEEEFLKQQELHEEANDELDPRLDPQAGKRQET